MSQCVCKIVFYSVQFHGCYFSDFFRATFCVLAAEAAAIARNNIHFPKIFDVLLPWPSSFDGLVA